MKQEICSALEAVRNYNITLIGDTIIDEYDFVSPKGRAVKDPIMSSDYLFSERYAGGVLAIANHLSNFVNHIDLITVLGSTSSHEHFVRESVNKNVTPHLFYKEGVTTVKKRYVDHVRNSKLFKVEYITDRQLTPDETAPVLEALSETARDSDLLFVSDFGHGFIGRTLVQGRTLVDEINQHTNKSCLNVQTNSANLGFNLATKYLGSSFLSLDKQELELALSEHGEDDSLLNQLATKRAFETILLTLGKQGNKTYRNGAIYHDIARAKKIVDVVGAGDAVFSICGLTHKLLSCHELSFLGNCVGALAVQIMGNKESISQEKLYDVIQSESPE